jgi:6,7-dimethyl-8-ribityllumazine synthase
MSGNGSPEFEVGSVAGLRLAIVAASWHEHVMTGLVAGAVRAADAVDVTFELFRVPGTFELPVVAQRCTRSGFDAVVALGVVIRGGTPHFEYVCRAATDGLTRVALDSGVPVGFGVLTCDDEAQALDRAGLSESSEDKGFEATMAALATASLLRSIDT